MRTLIASNTNITHKDNRRRLCHQQRLIMLRSNINNVRAFNNFETNRKFAQLAAQNRNNPMLSCCPHQTLIRSRGTVQPTSVDTYPGQSRIVRTMPDQHLQSDQSHLQAPATTTTSDCNECAHVRPPTSKPLRKCRCQ